MENEANGQQSADQEQKVGLMRQSHQGYPASVVVACFGSCLLPFRRIGVAQYAGAQIKSHRCSS